MLVIGHEFRILQSDQNSETSILQNLNDKVDSNFTGRFYMPFGCIWDLKIEIVGTDFDFLGWRQSVLQVLSFNEPKRITICAHDVIGHRFRFGNLIEIP